MNTTKIVEDMQEVIERFLKDCKDVNNQSAKKRCRKATLELARLGKLYRKYSIEHKETECK